MNNKGKFVRYAEMLRDWSGRMNLVAPSTLDNIETRHFADCAQLADVLPHGAQIIDLGSGAGFPGVVLAILGWDVVCIESIGKKVAFLTAVKDELVKILDYVAKINCRLFLLKGREIPAEISVAKRKYKFDYELIPSKTGDGFIIIIQKGR